MGRNKILARAEGERRTMGVGGVGCWVRARGTRSSNFKNSRTFLRLGFSNAQIPRLPHQASAAVELQGERGMSVSVDASFFDWLDQSYSVANVIRRLRSHEVKW